MSMSRDVVKINGCQEMTSNNIKPEGAKTRGRKPTTKGPNSKKQPQRGLGVEKLERLRLQERWKKMTEMPQPLQPPSAVLNFPVDYNSHSHFQTVQKNIPTISEPPLESVPVQYGAAGYGGGHHHHHQFLGMVHHQQRMGHVAGSGFGCGGGGSSPVNVGGGGGMVMELQRSIMVNPHYCYGIHGDPSPSPSHPVQMFPVGAAVYDHNDETSKELTSMPKTTPSSQHHHHDRSDFCFKKTRFNGENIGAGVRSEKCPDILQIGGLNIFGLNSENNVPNSSSSGELSLGLGSSTIPARSTSDCNMGVEVVAVHRKGNSVSGGVFMEYEFFPSCRPMVSGTGSKERIMKNLATEASVSVAGEASNYSFITMPTTTTYGADISNPVDLSLRL